LLFCVVLKACPLPLCPMCCWETRGADVLLPPLLLGKEQKKPPNPATEPAGKVAGCGVCGSGTASTTSKHAQATLHLHHVCTAMAFGLAWRLDEMEASLVEGLAKMKRMLDAM